MDIKQRLVHGGVCLLISFYLWTRLIKKWLAKRDSSGKFNKIRRAGKMTAQRVKAPTAEPHLRTWVLALDPTWCKEGFCHRRLFSRLSMSAVESVLACTHVHARTHTHTINKYRKNKIHLNVCFLIINGMPLKKLKLKPGMARPDFNPNIQEAEIGRSLWVGSQPVLNSEFQDSQAFVEVLSQTTNQTKLIHPSVTIYEVLSNTKQQSEYPWLKFSLKNEVLFILKNL